MPLLDNYRLYGIQAEKVDRVWSDARKMLEKALKYAQNRYDADSIYKAVKSREMQLWIICSNKGMQGAVITEIINFPLKKILSISFLAGVDFDKWSHNWSTIRDWATENDCSAVRIFGRAGWEKKLGSLGFKKTSIVLEAEL